MQISFIHRETLLTSLQDSQDFLSGGACFPDSYPQRGFTFALSRLHSAAMVVVVVVVDSEEEIVLFVFRIMV